METPTCFACGQKLAAGEDPGPLFNVTGHVAVCPECLAKGHDAVQSLVGGAESPEGPCGDPSCVNCAPPPHDLAGVITRASYNIAQRVAGEVEDEVFALISFGEIASDDVAVAHTTRHAIYATAAKILLDEAKEQAQEDPDGVRGSLHYAFALMSDHLSNIFGRRVAIQITERDAEPGA